MYGHRYEPSAESLMNSRNGLTDSTAPTYTEYGTSSVREPYPAWSTERNIPLSKEEIEDVFLDLTQKFGFQRDSMRNMFDFLMQQLDSRASRMLPDQALLTLHADYIGGWHANYRKWYFAAQLDLDDAVGHVQNPGLQRLKSKRGGRKPSDKEKSLNVALDRWRQAMNDMSPYDRLRQVALYLLCWGEAAQVRFCPECLCFIFKCADDYYRSPECQMRDTPVPEGLYLRAVIKPLYRFIRDQGYELVDQRFVRREKDHESIIGYDDINQLFWYPEGIARIVLTDKVSFTIPIQLSATENFLDPIIGSSSCSAVHEVRQNRLEPSILQDVLRKAIFHASFSQLQPYMGHPYILILVLHGIELSYGLCKGTTEPDGGDAMVSDSARRGGVHNHYDIRYSRRVFVYSHNMEQYLTSHSKALIPVYHPRSHRRPNILRRIR